MTVKLENACHNTDLLVAKQPRRHFRTAVRPVHWQLRSLMGVANQDTIYYPSGGNNLHIQRLNTTTRESETVRLLPFSPRCLVYKNGWICCGGEFGEFAAISVDGANEKMDLEADARLPIDLDPARPDDNIFSLLSRSRSAKSAIAKCHIFGRERVNCITLWFPPTQIPSAPGTYETGVAVLANNDKTVTIVSLNNTDTFDELSYPDCVNRALLSPDGGLLVAISDDPYLYVHQRDPKGNTYDYGVTPGGRQGRYWKLCTKLHLRGQRREDATESRGSFAACFSNTGKYLAIGTQYGVISIFNTAAFATDEDPLITCFTSSRPETEAGAVREMAFCPGPFDLLAWSEDRGHIGVADVRNNFISRQVLRIDEDDSFEHLSITEKSTIDPRLLDNRYDRGDAAAAAATTTTSNLASTLDISSEATRRSNRSRDLLDRYQYPLTQDETQVLEALQEHRRRRELREQRQRTALPEYTSPWPSRPSVRSTLAHDSSRARERSSSVSRAVNDILGNIQSQRDRIREAHERLRSREDAERRRLNYLPPRRGAAFGRAAEAEGPGSRDTPPSRVMPAGWDSLDALNSILTENNGGGGTLSTFSQLPSDPASSATFLGQLVSHGLVRDLTDLEGDFIQMRLRSRRQPPQPDETAGLAWSDDGTILYIGAESGIYEFHINVMARRMYPSFTLR